MKLSSKQISLISVFSALLIIVSRLPGIPIIGTSGEIELTVVLAPLIGIILGPWIGALTVFIGNFIAWLIPSTTFLGLLLLPTGPVAAVVSGSLARKDKKSDWKVAAVLLLALNALWYLTPPGQAVPYYPFLHIGALALILIFRDKVGNFIRGNDKGKITLGTSVSSFSGIMANHMTGNLIFIASVGWFVELKGISAALKNIGLTWMKFGVPGSDPTGLGTIFALVLPISVAERLIMTFIAVLIGVGIIYTLRKTGLITI